MPRPATSRHLEVLAFIEQYQEKNHRPPTVREIQTHFGFKSPRAASYYLEKLEVEKLIVRQEHSRGIVSTRADAPGKVFQLPFFNVIPAGLTNPQEGDHETEMLPLVPATLGIRQADRAYAVRVRGDSMENAAILNGDIVILENRTAQAGDIVAALLDGETTLKRLVKDQNRYWLKAENPRYPDLHPLESLQVQGVVVAVLRQVASKN